MASSVELDLCVVAKEVDAVVGCSVAVCGEGGWCSPAIFCDKAIVRGADYFVCVAEACQDVGGRVLNCSVDGVYDAASSQVSWEE